MTYEFFADEHGKHQFGGDIPDRFTVPENDFLSGFQYIGQINNEDPAFAWLPFRLNMICPIYLNIDCVFLDYTDPLNPAIIYPQNTGAIDSEYDKLDRDSVIIYNPMKVSLRSFGGIDEDNEFDVIGVAGEPEWLQEAAIPICPKTNAEMKFVCQITSWTDVTTKFTNVEYEDEFYQDYFNKMNFWGDGSLYVFMEPETRTVCYTMQNT